MAGAGDAGRHRNCNDQFCEDSGGTLRCQPSDGCKASAGCHDITGQSCSRTAGDDCHARRARACDRPRRTARGYHSGRARATRRSGATRRTGATRRSRRDSSGRTRATSRRSAAGGQAAAGEGRAAPACPHARCRGCTARAEGRSEYRSLQLGRRHHGQEQRERGALTAHLVLEGGAAWATLDMGPGHAPRQDLAADGRNPLARGRTGTITSMPTTDQGLTGLEDERLHLLPADAQHGCDLGVGVAPELKQDQSGALIGWEALHVLEHLAQVLALPDLISGAVYTTPIQDLAAGRDGVLARAEFGQASVPRDRVKPRPQRNVAVAGPQRPVGRHKRELQRILGSLAISQHMHAECEHARGVPIVDRLKRSIVTGAHARHQVIISIA
ncbi:MAG TPA: hypothetical protein VEF89_29135 [Solirubrobacteraceae bacterium]|nr:hypothetical protein [Solirubrobacteraceae bacterium]